MTFSHLEILRHFPRLEHFAMDGKLKNDGWTFSEPYWSVHLSRTDCRTTRFHLCVNSTENVQRIVKCSKHCWVLLRKFNSLECTEQSTTTTTITTTATATEKKSKIINRLTHSMSGKSVQFKWKTDENVAVVCVLELCFSTFFVLGNAWLVSQFVRFDKYAIRA